MSRLLSIVVFVIILILEAGCNGGRSSGTSFLNSGVKPTTNPTVTPSSTPTSSLQGIKSFTLNGVSYIGTESGKISDKTISVTTPLGTNINNLTATITTSDGGGVAHSGESLNIVESSNSESQATTTYKVSTASGITNGYIVTITIPQTLFSCIADTNESPAPASPCACLTQNDGSGLVWDVESMPQINILISGFQQSSNNVVESAQNYLNTVFNPKRHCGYTDWGVPNSESYGAYPNSLFSYNYYLWSVESSDQTDLGRLGYFAAHNSESSFNASESVAGFTGWLNQGPPVTPPLYANIAESMGMQPNWTFFISTTEPYSLGGGSSINYQFFLGTYQQQSVYSGLVGLAVPDGGLALGLLPVRGGK